MLTNRERVDVYLGFVRQMRHIPQRLINAAPQSLIQESYGCANCDVTIRIEASPDDFNKTTLRFWDGNKIGFYECPGENRQANKKEAV